MRQLDSIDDAILRAESATNVAHSSLYSVLGEGDGVDRDRIARRLASRIGRVPQLRHVLQRVPMELDRPWWLDDDDFDLTTHVRSLGLPATDAEHAEVELLGRLHERPLPRHRPLWELYVIDRRNGTIGVLFKVHHALARDTEYATLFALLLGDEPDEQATDNAGDDWVPRRRPSALDLTIKAAWRRSLDPIYLTRAGVAGMARIPFVGRSLVPTVLARRVASSPVWLHVPPRDRSAARLGFNRDLGPNRSIRLFSVPICVVDDAAERSDVDRFAATLGVISGATRRWLRTSGALPPQPLIALSPTRPDGHASSALALLNLHTDVSSPHSRLRLIAQELDHALTDEPAHDHDVLTELQSDAPLVASLATRLITRVSSSSRIQPQFNLIVVVSPSPEARLRVFGHPLDHQYTIGTLIDGAGLCFGVSIGIDTVDVSLTADPTLVTDLDQLIAALRIEADALTTEVRPAEPTSEMR